MTAQRTESAPVTGAALSAWRDMPAGLTPDEILAYRRGYTAAMGRHTVTAGIAVAHNGDASTYTTDDTRFDGATWRREPTTVTHATGAPAPGTAARKMLGRQLAGRTAAAHATGHAAAHKAGMSAVRSMLRTAERAGGAFKAGTVPLPSGERRPTVPTPAADVRWQVIMPGTGRTRAPRATRQTPAAKVRKVSKLEPCKRHAGWFAAAGRRRSLETCVEGGPGNGCVVGARCRLWPGTDTFSPDYCTGELDMPWTGWARVDNGPDATAARRAMFAGMGWSTTEPAAPAEIPAELAAGVDSGHVAIVHVGPWDTSNAPAAAVAVPELSDTDRAHAIGTEWAAEHGHTLASSDYVLARVARKSARRTLADMLRSRGLDPRGDVWSVATAAAGILPVHRDDTAAGA